MSEMKDMNRMLLGLIEEFQIQHNGPIPRHAVLNFCERSDLFALPRERIDEQIDLLTQTENLTETTDGLLKE